MVTMDPGVFKATCEVVGTPLAHCEMDANFRSPIQINNANYFHRLSLGHRPHR